MNPQSETYYSTAQVAERLDVSRQRIDQLLKSGELAGEQDPNTGRWRISAEALGEYLSTHPMRRPRRRLDDHQAFRELKGVVDDLEERLGSLEVRLGVVEWLLEELRWTLLRSLCEREGTGAPHRRKGNEPERLLPGSSASQASD